MNITVTFPISFRYDRTWRCKDVGKSEKQITEDIFQHTELSSNTLKGPRTYLARVSKEVKFHFRSMASSYQAPCC